MKLLPFLFLPLALIGCTAAPAIEPEPRIVRVEIPVVVPCKVLPVYPPVWAAESLSKTDSLEVKVRALLADRYRRMGYIQELQAALDGCR